MLVFFFVCVCGWGWFDTGVAIPEMQRATSEGTAGAPASAATSQVPAARQHPSAPSAPALHHTQSAPPQAGRGGAAGAVGGVGVSTTSTVQAQQRAYERSALSAAALVGGLTSWSAVLGWRRGVSALT